MSHSIKLERERRSRAVRHLVLLESIIVYMTQKKISRPLGKYTDTTFEANAYLPTLQPYNEIEYVYAN